jgi:hypothetical protein
MRESYGSIVSAGRHRAKELTGRKLTGLYRAVVLCTRSNDVDNEATLKTTSG